MVLRATGKYWNAFWVTRMNWKVLGITGMYWNVLWVSGMNWKVLGSNSRASRVLFAVQKSLLCDKENRRVRN